ncbi:MAG: nucleotidyltransferase family protein [Anaerolineales bacterium]
MAMKTALADALKKNRQKIFQIAKRHGVYNIRVFGSAVTGDAKPESDIDLLVDLAEGQSLFDLGAFLVEVEQILGVPVDVVTEKGLHWYIRDRVLEEAKEI